VSIISNQRKELEEQKKRNPCIWNWNGREKKKILPWFLEFRVYKNF